jgi:VWFA-related protein
MRVQILVAGVVASTAMVAAGGQGQPPVTFRSSSDIVEVHATVKLRNGTIARDLTRDDFELREDGKVREIAVFSRSVQPLSVALVLDHSGSTSADFSRVKIAAQEFVAHLLRGDRASVSTLMWDCQPFTADTRALNTVLNMELPPDFGSPIWSATDRAMTYLGAEGGRRVVLLLSDGQDTQAMAQAAGMPLPVGPPPAPPRPAANMLHPCEGADTSAFVSARDVINRAEREAVMVYTVSVGDATGDMDDLATKTGASHQKLGDYDELRAAFRSIADELHLQYVLGFAPSFTDGKSHDIDVKVKRSGVTVRARKGYVAAKTPGTLVSFDRVDPPQAGEPAEVRVGGLEFGLVLDGDGCQMGVGRQVAGRAQRYQQTEEDVAVPVARVEDDRRGALEPLADDGARLGGGKRMGHDLAVRGDPDEPQHGGPRQADRIDAVEGRLPPGARRLVTG